MLKFEINRVILGILTIILFKRLWLVDACGIGCHYIEVM